MCPSDDGLAEFAATLMPGTDGTADAMDAVDAFLSDQGVDSRTRHHVLLGLDELLSNLATHGNGGQHPATVRLRVRPERVEAELEDAGAPHDPREAAAPDIEGGLDDRAPGGLGLFLLATLAEAIAYARQDGRNVTTFAIRRTAASA